MIYALCCREKVRACKERATEGERLPCELTACSKVLYTKINIDSSLSQILYIQVDLDSKLGKSFVITKATPQSQSGGYVVEYIVNIHL